MPHLALRVLRARLLLAAVAVLALSVLAAPAGAATLVDDVLTTATCTGLLDGFGDTLEGELGALVDPSYCHTESSATVCAPEGSTCTTEVEEDTPDGNIQVNVTGVADPGGAMTLAVGSTSQTSACGQPMYVQASIRFESQGVSDLVATHRVQKSLDHVDTQNGAENIGVCYQSPKAFTDAEGNSTTYGLLPTCDTVGNAPPCIISRNKNKADAIVTMSLPPGDPVWKMVEEIVDDRTG